jgi:hypothetical protein
VRVSSVTTAGSIRRPFVICHCSHRPDVDAAPTRTFASSSSASEGDKLLLRVFIAYHVLQKMGFSEARISQCLLEGFGETDTWEEALDWVSGGTDNGRILVCFVTISNSVDFSRCGCISLKTSVSREASMPSAKVRSLSEQ